MFWKVITSKQTLTMLKRIEIIGYVVTVKCLILSTMEQTGTKEIRD